MRFPTTLASTVVLGLILAAPSLASDGEGLRPPVPGVPEIVVPDVGPISSPEAGPILLDDEVWLDQSQLVTGQDEAGHVGASVPVLGPSVEGPETEEDGTWGVVSALLEPDITAAADPVTHTPHEAPDELLSPIVDTSAPVSSTGNDSSVSQADDSASAEPSNADAPLPPNTAESASMAEPPSGTPPRSGQGLDGSGQPPTISEIDSPRYHNNYSQYQSEELSPQDPWHWVWSLTLDCAGNATSTSIETGSLASLIWYWDWVWDWACGSASSSTNHTNSTGSGTDFAPTSDNGNTNVSVRVSSGDTSRLTPSTIAAGTTEGAEATGTTPSSGIWTWSWTFAFCGETTSVSTQIDSQTPLSWTWNWMWNWTCEATAGAPPELGGATPSGPDAAPVPPLAPVIPAPPDSPTPAQAPVFTVDVPLPEWPLLPALPVAPSVIVDVAIPVSPGRLLPALPELALPSPGVSGVDVSVVIVPAETSSTTAPVADLPPVGGYEAPGHRGTESTTPPRTTMTIALQRPEGSPSGPSSKPTAKPPSAQPAPPRRAHGPLLPFGQSRSSETAGSGTFGGRVPIVPVAAVAALIAFFMLAAPRLGRRIRVARELSPRSTYRSSIDHPG